MKTFIWFVSHGLLDNLKTNEVDVNKLLLGFTQGVANFIKSFYVQYKILAKIYYYYKSIYYYV